MKTPDDIKKGLECALCDEPADICGEDCPCWSAYSPAELRQDEHVADALAYIQQLEADKEHLGLLRAADAEAYRHKLHELEAQIPRWIPVEERLPKHGAVVFCYTKYFYEVLQWDDDAEQWVGQYSVNAKHYVTHWMPLPKPPKEEK